jgi:4-hydroxy-2-oxoheptanedioate aldolase
MTAGTVNPLIESWRRGDPSLGIWSVLDDPLTIALFARSGADYICLDLQHGFATDTSMTAALASIRASVKSDASSPEAVVRVAWNRPEYIMRALDAGATTIIVPMVNSAEEAAAAVRAMKYPPDGGRSWGPMLGDVAGIAPTPVDANQRTACIVMVETREGVENIDEIAGVDGVDAVYIGPNDLALSCGFGRATYRDSPEVEALLVRLIASVRAQGKHVGLHCSSVETAREWAGRDVSMLTVATDSTLVLGAARQVIENARA